MGSERKHLPGRERCPHLPPVDEVWTARQMAVYRDDYGVEFYLATLQFAQSLWLEAKPAQALLQLNKAFLADVYGGGRELLDWPLPYAAKAWLLQQAGSDGFLGNPVRHYQHLATRMSGPRSELRKWRAWACFHLAEQILEAEAFPRDLHQIERERIQIPGRTVVLAQLGYCGLAGESALVDDIWAGARDF